MATSTTNLRLRLRFRRSLAKANTQVDAATLQPILSAFLKCRDYVGCMSAFETVTGLRADGRKGLPYLDPTLQNIVPNVYALDLYTGTSLLKAQAGERNYPAVKKVLSSMLKMRNEKNGLGRRILVDTMCFNIVLSAAQKAKEIEDAEGIFEDMEIGGGDNCGRDIVSYNTMLNIYARFIRDEGGVASSEAKVYSEKM